MQNARTARFPITLTKSEALRIQSEQIEHYAAMYGQDVRAIVAQASRRSGRSCSRRWQWSQC